MTIRDYKELSISLLNQLDHKRLAYFTELKHLSFLDCSDVRMELYNFHMGQLTAMYYISNKHTYNKSFQSIYSEWSETSDTIINSFQYIKDDKYI